jgi:hypothetical protein
MLWRLIAHVMASDPTQKRFVAHSLRTSGCIPENVLLKPVSTVDLGADGVRFNGKFALDHPERCM